MSDEDDHRTSRDALERDHAIQFLMRTLAAEQINNPDFPKLSQAAMTELAEEIVDRNGYVNHARNEHDAIAEVFADRDRWEYHGAFGGLRKFCDRLRRIYRRIFVVTEEVRRR